VDPLTLTIVLYLFKSLYQYHISKLSSTPFLLLSISFFVVYTVNLPMFRPRSCRVIYYFDTPTLRRRHQSFDRVNMREKWLAHIKGKDLNEEDMDIPLIKVTFPYPTYVIQLEEEVKKLNQMFVDSSIHNLIDNENEGYDEELMPKNHSH